MPASSSCRMGSRGSSSSISWSNRKECVTRSVYRLIALLMTYVVVRGQQHMEGGGDKHKETSHLLSGQIYGDVLRSIYK